MDGKAWSSEAFGGAAGRVVREALGIGTFLTGIFLVGVSALTGVLAFRTGVDALGILCVHLLFAVMLGRFALQGFHGHWNTGAIYPRQAGWGPAGVVALRYLALCLLWTVPIILLGLRPDALRESMGGMALLGAADGGGKIVTLAVVYIAAAMLTPPILLIVSVSAERFAGIFSPHHWVRLFRGRRGDLFLVYALSLGGVAMSILLVAPILVAVSVQAPKLALFLTAVASVWALGFAVSVYGRLCGCFASPLREGGDIREPALRLIASRPPAAGPVEPDERGLSVADSGGIGETDPGDAGAAASTLTGRPPLLDARERVEAILEGAEGGSDAAIIALERLRDRHAPNPLIQYGLCLALIRAGQRDRAVATAGEALPLLLDRGNRRLAARIYGDLLEERGSFDLTSDHLVTLAADFLERGETPPAIEALMQAIRHDPWHRRAIKRLMQVAEELVPASRSPHEALRIYRFLIEQCPDSPLAEMMQNGLRDAERSVEKADRRRA